MSLNERSQWLVAYDIADARRGASLLRLMKKHGVPLQYSVFVVEASAAAMQSLMHENQRLIRPSVDDVRAYRVPAIAEYHQLGRSLLPEGVLLAAGPHSTAGAPLLAELHGSERVPA